VGCVKGIIQALHPRFFSGGRILFYDTFPGGGIYLFYHILKSHFRFADFFFSGQEYKFFCTGPNGTLYRLVSKAAFFTLPMTFFGGTAFTCQRKTPTIQKLSLPYR
jgi:hypothetical protein